MPKSKAPQGLQIGDKVRLPRWVFTSKEKPKKFGFIENINGAYILIRPSGVKNRLFELYPNEFKVVKHYQNSQFQVGDRVKLKHPERLDWGKAKPRDEGFVAGVRYRCLVVRFLGLPSFGRGSLRQYEILARDLIKLPGQVKACR